MPKLVKEDDDRENEEERYDIDQHGAERAESGHQASLKSQRQRTG
jgi:hypothetical protein